MYILLLSLVVLAVVAYVAGRLQHTPDKPLPAPQKARPEGCCGLHEVCEKMREARARRAAAEYYDDEELDAYRGRSAGSYTPEETAEFREVLETMRPAEVSGWLRSLSLRGISLPESLRQRALAIGDRLSPSAP